MIVNRGPNWASWGCVTIVILILLGVLGGAAAGDTDLFNWITAGAEADQVRSQIRRDDEWFRLMAPLELERAWADLKHQLFLLTQQERVLEADNTRKIEAKDLMVMGGIKLGFFITALLAMVVAAATGLALWRWVDYKIPARRDGGRSSPPPAVPTATRPHPPAPQTQTERTGPLEPLVLVRNGTAHPASSANGGYGQNGANGHR